ncbi:hypothetical protein [Mycolicibacterium llatzerense]|uniref:hypothetical protein n=1 Tax=Mycolicibacterium llatzerense TaxID=280871 RepID=UPI0013A6EB1F|nr:hypothetical protein [Mycolicibacterium llatzerense]
MDLQEQLHHLDQTLLANVGASFPEPLTEAEKAQVHAYLVLAHAVLEECLEAMFLSHFDSVIGRLGEGLVPIECVRLAYAVADNLPEKIKISYSKRETIKLVQTLGRKEFEGRIRLNHGLKTENVQYLAKGVGLDWCGLEDELSAELADLNTLGVKRGSAGHLSPFTERVTNISADSGPDDVRLWVEAGRTAVEKLESYLASTLHTN